MSTNETTRNSTIEAPALKLKVVETSRTESDDVILGEVEQYKFNPIGFLYGVASHICLSSMHVFVKLIYQNNPLISKYEIIYWRGFLLLIFNLLYLRWQGQSVFNIPREYRKVMLLRCTVGFMSLQGSWGAYQILPLNLATTIIMTSPISTAIVTRIFLKEKMSKWDILSSICGFVGVLVIIDPFQSKAESQENESNQNRNFVLGMVLAISASVFNGFIDLCMRYMRCNIHYALSPFWFSTGCAFFGPLSFSIVQIFQPVGENPSEVATVSQEETLTTTKYDPWTIFYLLCLAFVAFFGQNFISKAFQMEKAMIISPLIYIQFVITLLFDIVIQKEVFHTKDILGSFLIVGVLFTIAILKSCQIIK